MYFVVIAGITTPVIPLLPIARADVDFQQVIDRGIRLRYSAAVRVDLIDMRTVYTMQPELGRVEGGDHRAGRRAIGQPGAITGPAQPAPESPHP